MQEDEEDLEFLRLAALKSLNAVAKTKSPPKSYPDQHFRSIEVLHVGGNSMYNQTPIHNGPPNSHVTNFAPSLPMSYYGPPQISQVHPSYLPATNVQLSPRSMAFVAQNNDIINRRNRSPSPRWSASRGWSSSRSQSPRSPIRSRSPARSPPPLFKRNKLSPPLKSTNLRRSRSRSPIHKRSRSPQSGHNSKFVRNRSISPKYRPLSPVRNYSPKNSPKYNNQRQPNSKFNRNRASPVPKYNDTNAKRPQHNNVRNNSRTANNRYQSNRNHDNNVKAHSPRPVKRSLTPEKPKDSVVAREKTPVIEKKPEIADKKEVSTEIKEEKPMTKAVPAAVPKPSDDKKEKTQEELEDELLASSGDDSDIEIDLDIDAGLDLFASEESESENEGRFKLNSNNKKKPANNVSSFSKLGKTSTANMRELKDFGSSSSSRYDRNSRYGNNHKRSYEDSKSGSKFSSNSSYNDHRRGSPKVRVTSNEKSVDKNSDKSNDKKDEKEKIMFKPTFKTIESAVVNTVKKEGKQFALSTT